jgi:Rrf2 family protein
MLTQTSELGIQVLLHLVLLGEDAPVSPRRIAESISSSPTYMSKVAGLLVRAGILRSHRGFKGGVTLAADPRELTLLEIVEACQGKVLGDFCQPFDDLNLVCSYHRAMAELHDAIIKVLSRWTLADLAERPQPDPSLLPHVKCKLRLAVAKVRKQAKKR